MINKKLITAVSLLLLTLFILAACASKEEAQSVNIEYAAPVEAVVEEEFAGEPAAEQAMDAPSEAETANDLAAATSAPASANQAGNAPSAPQGRLIIKDGNMVVVVAQTETAVDATTRLVVDLGGYIISQHVFNDAQGYRYATMQLAVPVLNFEDAMRTLRTLGDVVNESASGDDVTSEFVDLNSRLDNLDATRARLQSFLDQAETVEQALEVNKELKVIEEEMALIQGRINFLSDRAAFSTIDLTIDPWIPTPTPSPTPTITPTYTPTPIPTPHEWRPGDTAGTAAVKLQNSAQGTADFFIYYGIICGPWLLIFALLLYLIWRLEQWLRKKRHPNTPIAVEVSDEEE